MKTLIISLWIALTAWGCASIIARHYGIFLPLFTGFIYKMTWWAGPVLLGIPALYAWSKARQWRRKSEIKATFLLHGQKALARGAVQAMQPARQRSTLEGMMALLIILALASVPYWLGISIPEVWAVAGLLVWWAAKGMLR